MKARKLTNEEFNRSVKNDGFDHFYVYNTNINSRKSIASFHNSISMLKYLGDPFFCLVIERHRIRHITDDDLSAIFGEGCVIDGGPSPEDKENMIFDSFYIFK